MKLIKAIPLMILTALFGFYSLIFFNYLTKPSAYLADIEDKQPFGLIKNNPNAVFHAVIRLKTSDDRFYCSGFVVDGRYAITAAHCVDSVGSGIIRIYDRNDLFTGVEASVLGYNHRNDSAVIMGDFTNFKAVPIEKDKHGFIGSNGPFMTCGYPYGQKQLYCSYALPVSTENFAMKLTGALIPGMSGGPVFDLNTGKVVGLNSAVEGEFIIVNPLTGVLASFGVD